MNREQLNKEKETAFIDKYGNEWLPINHYECGFKGEVNLNWAKKKFAEKDKEIKQKRKDGKSYAYEEQTNYFLFINCKKCGMLQELSRACVYQTCHHSTEIIPEKLPQITIQSVRIIKGNILSHNGNGDEIGFRLWFDNTKQMNDIAGHLELMAYRNMLNEESWRELKNQWQGNQDDSKHYSFVIDEQNRILNFQRDREMEQYIKAKKAMGIRGRAVWLLD